MVLRLLDGEFHAVNAEWHATSAATVREGPTTMNEYSFTFIKRLATGRL